MGMSATELAIHRANTARFINANSTSLILIPKSEVWVNGSKSMVSGQPRTAQLFKLIYAGGAGIARGASGSALEFDFIIVGNWDASIAIGDYWSEGSQEDGTKLDYVIEYLYPYNEYEVKAGELSTGVALNMANAPLSASISFDSERLRQDLERFDAEFDKKVGAVFDYNAAYIETWMKTNAPWTDRTGAARSGLTAIASHAGSVHELFMAYSVSYGIWLEVANSGKYQVMGPAMVLVGQKIMSDLTKIFGRELPTGSIPNLPPVARATAKPNTNKSGSRRSRKAYGQRQGGRQQ